MDRRIPIFHGRAATALTAAGFWVSFRVMNRAAVPLILIVSTTFLLLNLNAPLTDGMAVKQVFVAHKARAIAGPPFDLMRSSFDFLEPDGQRLVLTEEVPLYTGVIAVGYSLFGEHEFIGRLLSVLATLIAILAFRDLVALDSLAERKRVAIALEAELESRGEFADERPVNIDPGLLTLGKFMLATTKDQAHRLYLRDGIFAEVTLRYEDGEWVPWPWTYADYREDAVRSFLNRCREYYKERLRS